jgi:hypothetical protein
MDRRASTYKAAPMSIPFFLQFNKPRRPLWNNLPTTPSDGPPNEYVALAAKETVFSDAAPVLTPPKPAVTPNVNGYSARS